MKYNLEIIIIINRAIKSALFQNSCMANSGR